MKSAPIGEGVNGFESGSHEPQPVTYEGKLSRIFKDSTSEIHKQVSGHPFANKLVEGTVGKAEYSRYLTDLFAIYSKLEKCLEENKSDPCVGPLCIQGLYRSEALKRDLQYFEATNLHPGKAAVEFQTHLEGISKTHPYKLVSYAYMRYMGDLFGGQVIVKEIEGRWKEGVAFYTFKQLKEDFGLPQPARFVAKFRKILDALPLQEGQADQLVEEVKWSYNKHIEMFNELSSSSSD